MEFKSIDLFAGIGGIRKGFDNAFGKNIKTVFVSEWDKAAQRTYEANFHDAFEINGDKAFQPISILSKCNVWMGYKSTFSC